uniref:phosphodiester glycosidase family protein n=1 Tax=Alistipes sp. TaxID=1872444 RepID=UPI00405641D7
MKELKEIQDDQIRIIGEEVNPKTSSRKMRFTILALAALLLVALIAWGLWTKSEERKRELTTSEQTLFEPHCVESPAPLIPLGREVDSLSRGFTEIKDTVVNDIPLRIFIPHNAELSLHIGKMDRRDTSVIYTAQAADIRADNGKIVGAFVLKGEPRAWGLSKRGFCASIDGVVTVGVADNSPLFEEATEKEGYFFRQYPLVENGKLVENQPKNKSIRRAICDRQGEIFMVESGTAESFHDFSQALVDLGCDQAVYLVGSSAYGWAVDESGERHEFGDENFYRGRRRMPKNTSYIVWRRR